MTEQMPRLVLGQDEPEQPSGTPAHVGPARVPQPAAGRDLFGDYVAALRQSEKAWQGELRVLLGAIVREGRRFALTPEGARWKAFLAGSTLVRNGWLAWNASGLDFLLRSEDETEFTPSQLWQQITAGLAALEVEPFLVRLTQDLSYYGRQPAPQAREVAPASS